MQTFSSATHLFQHILLVYPCETRICHFVFADFKSKGPKLTTTQRAKRQQEEEEKRLWEEGNPAMCVFNLNFAKKMHLRLRRTLQEADANDNRNDSCLSER